MRPIVIIRRAWAAFVVAASLEWIYLASELPFVSVTLDRLVALGLATVGAFIGVAADVAVTNAVRRRGEFVRAAEDLEAVSV